MQEDAKPPIAVIGFSDQASPLEPLWPSTHRSLMPIAGKSLIIYLIEQLADEVAAFTAVAGKEQRGELRRHRIDLAEEAVEVVGHGAGHKRLAVSRKG